MKILIVEDDFASRKLLGEFLLPYGVCELAANGREGLEAYKSALSEEKPYDLVCLDIMMPEMNGHEVLAAIRDHEKSIGVGGRDSVKILMTTAVTDPKNILKAFNSQCEGYMLKPISRKKLVAQLEALGLLEKSA